MKSSISKLNTILSELNIPIEITSLDDIIPSLWIAIYESLMETRITSKNKDLKILFDKLHDIGKVDLDINIDDVRNNQPDSIYAMIYLFWDLLLDVMEIHELNDQYYKNNTVNDTSIGNDSINTNTSIGNGTNTSIVNGSINRNTSTVNGSINTKSNSENFINGIIQKSTKNILESSKEKSKVKNKKTRFNLKNTINPELKELQLKYALLNNPIQSTQESIKELLSLHQKICNLPCSKQKLKVLEAITKSENESLHEISEIKPNQSVSSNSNTNNIDLQKTRTELNLESFFNQVESQIPFKLSNREKSTAWSHQINLTKHSLDHRIWNHKVQIHKLVTSLSTNPTLKNIKQDERLHEFHKEKKDLQKAKANMNNRKRRLVYLGKKYKEISQPSPRHSINPVFYY
jgi:hypothetical protein